MVMGFVDFAAAFDPVDRSSLWGIMAADGMPAKLLRLIKAHETSTKAKVGASGGESLSLELRPGVQHHEPRTGQKCLVSLRRTVEPGIHLSET